MKPTNNEIKELAIAVVEASSSPIEYSKSVGIYSSDDSSEETYQAVDEHIANYKDESFASFDGRREQFETDLANAENEVWEEAQNR